MLPTFWCSAACLRFLDGEKRAIFIRVLDSHGRLDLGRTDFQAPWCAIYWLFCSALEGESIFQRRIIEICPAFWCHRVAHGGHIDDSNCTGFGIGSCCLHFGKQVVCEHPERKVVRLELGLVAIFCHQEWRGHDSSTVDKAMDAVALGDDFFRRCND